MENNFEYISLNELGCPDESLRFVVKLRSRSDFNRLLENNISFFDSLYEGRGEDTILQMRKFVRAHKAGQSAPVETLDYLAEIFSDCLIDAANPMQKNGAKNFAPKAIRALRLVKEKGGRPKSKGTIQAPSVLSSAVFKVIQEQRVDELQAISHVANKYNCSNSVVRKAWASGRSDFSLKSKLQKRQKTGVGCHKEAIDMLTEQIEKKPYLEFANTLDPGRIAEWELMNWIKEQSNELSSELNRLISCLSGDIFALDFEGVFTHLGEGVSETIKFSFPPEDEKEFERLTDPQITWPIEQIPRMCLRLESRYVSSEEAISWPITFSYEVSLALCEYCQFLVARGEN